MNLELASSLLDCTPRLDCTPLPAVWRLGFATRLVGAPLRAHDSRRWAQQPHLSVSLAYLRDIFGYLSDHAIRFYRLSSTLAPYATHPDLPAFHRQIDECRFELAVAGDEARAAGIRLTMHPGPFVQLGSEHEGLAARSVLELQTASDLLDAMGMASDSVLVVHASGRDTGIAAQDQASLGRMARQIAALPPSVRSRLVIENGDRAGPIEACLWLHARTGAPIVLDVLHHRCLNPARRPLDDALSRALATWPPTQRPKVHLSSSRTELRVLRRGGRDHVIAPLPSQHSDFINPFEAIDLLRMARGLGLRPFDVLLEAKAHDLALIRLREQIAHYAPEIGALTG